jgi:hypothetical protein
MRQARAIEEVCLDAGKRGAFGVSPPSPTGFDHLRLARKAVFCCPSRSTARSWLRNQLNPVNIGL